MTSPKERAIDLMTGFNLPPEVTQAIEKAITDAVNEDRQSRECCKAAAKQEWNGWWVVCQNEIKNLMNAAQYCRENNDPTGANIRYLAAAMVERLPEKREVGAPF